MSRRCGSAIALNASDVVAARAMQASYSHNGIRQAGATIFVDSTPQLYQRWLTGAIRLAQALSTNDKLIFINAWNEWAEGNHLEPDLEQGRAYLEATRDALATAELT